MRRLKLVTRFLGRVAGTVLANGPVLQPGATLPFEYQIESELAAGPLSAVRFLG